MGEKQNTKKVRVPKAVRKTAVSVVVLLLLFVIAGIAYTWYMDQSPSATTNSSAPSAPKEVILKPTMPAANADESAAIEFLTTPVAPGDDASVNVKTLSTSSCSISVVYNNVPSTDPGLRPKTADDFGTVGWNWTVGTNVPDGTWPVKVVCSHNGKTAVVQGDLQVAR